MNPLTGSVSSGDAKSTRPVSLAVVARPACLCRRIDLVGDGSNPRWVIALVGMRRGFRICADCIQQSYVEVPIERVQVAAPDQPEFAASLHNHLTAVGRR